MPLQDRTGSLYEQLIAASLLRLGYRLNNNIGLNYLHPGRNRQIVIPNTYIQPDFVVREDEEIQAIIYVTHWSNTRSSHYKFWRTWEEEAQQKAVLENSFLSINCIFEALSENSQPQLYITSDDIPRDDTSDMQVPLQFNGWYAGTTWAMAEAFDVSLVFPVGYYAIQDIKDYDEGDHASDTTMLLQHALYQVPKLFFQTQWQTLKAIRQRAIDNNSEFNAIQSRYRIGLLHVYLFYRMLSKITGQNAPALSLFISSLVVAIQQELRLDNIGRYDAFRSLSTANITTLFRTLSQVYVRSGTNPTMFCTLRPFSVDSNSIYHIEFNDDLKYCLQDLNRHIIEPGFLDNVAQIFAQFDRAYGVTEALDDLANIAIVREKEAFVRTHFAHVLSDERQLNHLLQTHAKQMSPSRAAISMHNQNWVTEMLLYMAGLNTTEDIQKRFKSIFEASGHRTRPHSPYGDYAKLVSYCVQGRDICEQWINPNKRRTLTENEFRTLSWQSIAACIVQAFRDRGNIIQSNDTVIMNYLQNKSGRIINSELNGFNIMINHYLNDLCIFTFTEAEEDEPNDGLLLQQRILATWQTDVINALWHARPLKTGLQGVSLNGKWLIKFQSAQDGHESDKTKELAGRSRAFHLRWHHGDDPRNRNQWSFDEHPNLKVALVLDGDWSVNNIRNLYEAGWDWVGGVSDLQELRDLITAEAENT